MIDRQKTIIPTSPRAPDPLCARLIRETTLYFMDLLNDKDREIADLKDRLDPGNYCEGCGCFDTIAFYEKKVSDMKRDHAVTVSILNEEVDHERRNRYEAEEQQERCEIKNKKLMQERDRSW